MRRSQDEIPIYTPYWKVKEILLKRFLYTNMPFHPGKSVPKGGAPLWIGELNDGRGFVFKGVMDELGIWSKALSEGEIKLAMEGKAKWAPVEPQEKLTTTWGEIKSR